jgi:sec-independent protein translocase protein TatB
MPNFTLSEILTIMLVILVVFGPNRLPEMAQKAGQLVRRSRQIINDLRREFEGEWREVAEPLQDVRQEVMGIKDDVQSSLKSVNEDVARAKRELEAEMKGLTESDAGDEAGGDEVAGDAEETLDDESGEEQ